MISTSRFAKANNIDSKVVDGNDIVEVTEAAKDLINEIRKTSSPKFLEAITYRHYGHVDWREDSDVGVNRSQVDINLWKKRDPITRLTQSLIIGNLVSEKYIEELSNEINEALERDWELALSDPYPNTDALLERVYD